MNLNNLLLIIYGIMGKNYVKEDGRAPVAGVVPEVFRKIMEGLEKNPSCSFVNSKNWPYVCNRDGEELDIGMLGSLCYGNSGECSKIKSTLDILSRE